MARIIKIKESELVKIVENSIKETQFNSENLDLDEDVDNTNSDIQIGKDEQGRHYVINVKTGEILGIK